MPLAGDASQRKYFRIAKENRTWVLCWDEAMKGAHLESYPCHIVYTLLKEHGIPVPSITLFDSETGFLLEEDCGDVLLEEAATRMNPRALIRAARALLDTMVRIQGITGPSDRLPFSRSFHAAKLMQEFEFFILHGLLGHFHCRQNRIIGRLREAFSSLSVFLDRPEWFVLNHRDFHSRNILVGTNRFILVDYQDAMMGLPQYDAVSFLRDAYMILADEQVQELKRYHFGLLEQNGYRRMSWEQYQLFFAVMAFQRNVKAAGTFCFQAHVRGNARFQSSIPVALGYLPSYRTAHPLLDEACDLLFRVIGKPL